MENFEQTNLKRSIETLGDHSGDKLRAAQKLITSLASIPDQEQAVWYAIQVFTALTQPQRLTLLQTVRAHLKGNKCPAIIPHRFIIHHVLDRLETEITRKKGVLFKKEVHGTKKEIAKLASLIQDIRVKILKIFMNNEALVTSQNLQPFFDTLKR